MQNERISVYSSLTDTLLSEFFPISPALQYVKLLKIRSQSTYSRSWRLQLGCRKASHRSFTPSSCRQFDPRSRCFRLLLWERGWERFTAEWGEMAVPQPVGGQCEEMESLLCYLDLYIFEEVSKPLSSCQPSIYLRSNTLLPHCLFGCLTWDP